MNVIIANLSAGFLLHLLKLYERLNRYNFRGLPTLIPTNCNKFNTLTFCQGFISVTHNRVVVYENIFTFGTDYEPVAFRIVKPFDGAVFSVSHFFSLKLVLPRLPVQDILSVQFSKTVNNTTPSVEFSMKQPANPTHFFAFNIV